MMVSFVRYCCVLTLTLLALVPRVLVSAPVSEEETIPIDVRRTTLLVRDVDRSLALYRDALGMKVIYDEIIRRPPSESDPDAGERRLRLALLRANDDFVGVIGLLEYQNPRPPDPGVVYEWPRLDGFILVINATDLEERFDKVRAVPGVVVEDEPSLVEYPAPGGKGTIPVLVSGIFDPDGYVLELNQILGTPAGQ